MRIIWCMGVLAALGAVGSVVQAAADGNIVRTALPRVITVRESGNLEFSEVPLSLGERLLIAAPPTS